MVHPFLRMHLVHTKNGQYITKTEFMSYHSPITNSVYHNENRTVVSHLTAGGKASCTVGLRLN